MDSGKDSRLLIPLVVMAKQPMTEGLLTRAWSRRPKSARLMPGVEMTADVKSWPPLLYGFLRLVPFSTGRAGASQSTGCSCGDPWAGDHRTCIRRVPASLEARGCAAASSRRGG